MRRRGRVDVSQKEIVRVLRSVGASVVSLADVGGGCPDLLVGHSGKTFLMECKSPRHLSGGKKVITPQQTQWMHKWSGRPVAIVESPGDALTVIGLPEVHALGLIAEDIRSANAMDLQKEETRIRRNARQRNKRRGARPRR